MRQEITSGGQPATGSAGGEMLDLGQIWRALKRSAPFILGFTLVVLVGSLIGVNVVSPRYSGESKLLLENRDSYYTRLDPNDRDTASFDAEAVQSQVQVIMSRDLARAAIAKLALVGNAEFDPALSGLGALSRLMVLLGIEQHPADRDPDERVLETYYDRLLVFPVGKSRVVSVEFTSRDPDLAARGANTIAGLYLEMQGQAKQSTARSASSWLSGTIDPLRQRVAESEAKVEEFRARTGLLVGTNNTTITAQQLAELSTQLAAARTARADAQAKAKLIRDMIRTHRIFDIPDVANNDLIRRFAEQRVTLRGQLALESRTLLPAHPRIKELNAQLADLETQMRAAAQRTVSTLENDAKVAAARVDSVTAALDSQKLIVTEANEQEIQLRALERDAKTQRDQLESYLVKYREAQARDTEEAQPANARIVSRAVAPTVPSFPKKLPIVLLATLASLVLSTGLVVTRELLSGRVLVGDEARPRHDGAPREAPAAVAVAAPMESDAARPSAVALTRLKSVLETRSAGEASIRPAAPAGGAMRPAGTAIAERAAPMDAFGELVRDLPAAHADGRGRRILVTEPASAHGALATARALGRHLAGNERVILVSASDDAIAPDRLGLTDLVLSKASFAEIIGREAGSRLHIMAPGTRDAMLLTQEQDTVDFAFTALDQTYDWVLFVLPGDTRAALVDFFAARTDAAIVAVRQRAAAVDLCEALHGAGARHVIVALTAEADSAAA